jgi:DNA-binding winged helix-turn-helix (wHTH) protein
MGEQRFRLGEWIVNPADGSLSGDGRQKRLEPQLMRLLLVLCSHAGEVVSKADLLDGVWGSSYVSDDTIKSSFYHLRKALDDDRKHPRFIETLPKRGYRLLQRPDPFVDTPAPIPSRASLEQSRIYYERTVQQDASNAKALAELAHTYVNIAMTGAGKPHELFPSAKAAAARAAQIDKQCASAHVARAAVAFVYEYDTSAAEAAFQEALQIAPNDPRTQAWYARFLSSSARHTSAVKYARAAVESEPLSLTARRDLIEVLFNARRYEEAVAEAQQLLRLSPGASEIQLGLVFVYFIQGREHQALDTFLAGLQMLEVSQEIIERVKDAYENQGMQGVLRGWIAALERDAHMGKKTRNDVLALYALLGEYERAFAVLERAFEDADPYLAWLEVSPLYDQLRKDPRYAAFAERLRSPQPFPNP